MRTASARLQKSTPVQSGGGQQFLHFPASDDAAESELAALVFRHFNDIPVRSHPPLTRDAARPGTALDDDLRSAPRDRWIE